MAKFLQIFHAGIIIVGAFLFVNAAFAETAPQPSIGPCALAFPAGSKPAANFGVSYNIFNPGELLMKAICLGTTATVTVGSSNVVDYTFQTGYSWTGSTWRPFTLTGGKMNGSWYTGTGTASIPLSPPNTYFVNYICLRSGNAWKCGCKDDACNSPAWQLQVITGVTSGPIGSSVADLPHKGDTQLLECGQGVAGTQFYFNALPEERVACRNAVKARGYTHVYVDLVDSYNNYYGKPQLIIPLLEELVADDLKPVVYLSSDNGTSWISAPFEKQMEDIRQMIPAIDQFVSSYSIGMEADQWWSKEEAAQVGTLIKSLSQKPIANHQLANKVDYCVGASWCDYQILQMSRKMTVDGISAAIQKAMAALGGKPVVAGIYVAPDRDEATAVNLGAAAVAAGASGFMQGGPP